VIRTLSVRPQPCGLPLRVVDSWPRCLEPHKILNPPSTSFLDIDIMNLNLDSLKEQVSNLSLYDLKAGVRKVQNAVMNYTEMEAKVNPNMPYMVIEAHQCHF
jgi:hypothetical protein